MKDIQRDTQKVTVGDAQAQIERRREKKEG